MTNATSRRIKRPNGFYAATINDLFHYDCAELKDIWKEGLSENEVIKRLFGDYFGQGRIIELERMGLPDSIVEYDGQLHESFADCDATFFLDKLAKKEPFVINRIGEAPFASACYRVPIKDCQMERVHYNTIPMLEWILSNEQPKDYFITITMALWNPGFRFCTIKTVECWDKWGIKDRKLCNHQMLFGEALKDGLQRFFKATEGAVVIGPPRYEEHRAWIKYSHLVPTRPTRAGIFWERTYEHAKALLSTLPAGQVVLVAASNASPPLIHALYEEVGPQHTYWNVGSVYDMPINLVFEQHNDDFKRRWGHVPQLKPELFDWMTLGDA